MADIAFLLLIFFLVITTIETDVGLERMLPHVDGNHVKYQKRNILSVLVNRNGDLLINDLQIKPELLKKNYYY